MPYKTIISDKDLKNNIDNKDFIILIHVVILRIEVMELILIPRVIFQTQFS